MNCANEAKGEEMRITFGIGFFFTPVVPMVNAAIGRLIYVVVISAIRILTRLRTVVEIVFSSPAKLARNYYFVARIIVNFAGEYCRGDVHSATPRKEKENEK